MNDSPQVAPIRSWASERLSSGIRRSLDKLARSDDVRHIAVMPDVHLGRDVCVGTAFATTTLLYPDAIGGDIGCGMTTMALDASRTTVSRELAPELHRAIGDAVPIHRQRAESAERLLELVPAPEELSDPTLAALARSEGPHQIGTLGTGNHFLELQFDEADERLWLLVHSGSRGMGQAIRALHVSDAQRSRNGFACTDVSTDRGRAYWRDMEWARRFAAANRRAMLTAVGTALSRRFGWSPIEDSLLDCDHNHINAEDHFGRTTLVHRKGAMAAWLDQLGIVPGSMAAPSFHVVGRGVPEALCSSAHGAGRAMSRTEARSRIDRERLAGELRDVHVDQRAIGGLREEAPSAYKDIRAVMKAQRKLVRVRRTLLPLLTHRASSREKGSPM